MCATIEYKPARLAFQAFRAVDVECFADEPVDEGTFREFLAGDFWAAWDSQRFIGYCYVQRKPDFAWLRRIAVTGDHRRLGIGGLLMQTAVKHCEAVGLPESILYVEDDNQPALGLYKSFGFRPDEATYQYSVDLSRIPCVSAPGENEIDPLPIEQVPQADLPAFPRQWADIRKMHSPPGQYVFIFLHQDGRHLGYCRLTPSFPGCFPFVIADPNRHLLSVLTALRKYLLPEKGNLKLTFSDPAIAEACDRESFQLHYRLLKMIRSPKEGRVGSREPGWGAT